MSKAIAACRVLIGDLASLPLVQWSGRRGWPRAPSLAAAVHGQGPGELPLSRQLACTFSEEVDVQHGCRRPLPTASAAAVAR